MSFIFVWILLTIDYKKIEADLQFLLAEDATKNGSIGNIEVQKFPFPVIIVRDIDVPGVFHANKARVDFIISSILKRRPQISEITIDEPALRLRISAAYENDVLSYGKATLRTDHISKFLSNYPDLKEMITDAVPADETTITFDIVSGKKYLTLTNMKVDSGSLSCVGQVDIAQASTQSSGLKLSCDKIRLVDDEMTNVEIAGDANKDTMNITTASGNLASGGSFQLAGNITKNAHRSMFSGKVALAHNDINAALIKVDMGYAATTTPAKTILNGDLVITPVEIIFSNIKGDMGTLKLDGNFELKLIGETPRLLFRLGVNGFDSSVDSPVITPLAQYAASMFQNLGDKTYLVKFTPIRDIQYIGNFDISFGPSIVSDQKVDAMKFSGRVGGGALNIDSFEYSAGDNHLLGSAALSTISLKPDFKLNVTGGSWHTDGLTMENFLFLASQDTGVNKISMATDIKLDALSQNDYSFHDFKFKANNTNDIINIDILAGNLGLSHIQMNGNLTTGLPLNANLAYVYNGIDVSRVSSIFSSSVGLTGIANSVGTISTNGDSAEALLYNLYMKSKFIATDLQVNGCNIDAFIKKLNDLQYNPKDMNKDFDLALSSSSMKLSNITGDYGIDSGILSFKNIALTTPLASSTFALDYNVYNQDLNLSSLWSFYFSLSDSNTRPNSFGFTIKKDGQDFVKHLDNTSLLKAFRVRNGRNSTDMMNDEIESSNTKIKRN